MRGRREDVGAVGRECEREERGCRCSRERVRESAIGSERGGT